VLEEEVEDVLDVVTTVVVVDVLGLTVVVLGLTVVVLGLTVVVVELTVVVVVVVGSAERLLSSFETKTSLPPLWLSSYAPPVVG